MNLALYQTMLQKNAKTFLGYGLGSSLFILLEVFMFPSIQESLKAKADILDTMPDGVLAAFGLEKGQLISTLSDLLSVQYYSMLFLILLAIFTVTMAAKLIAHLVEQGGMAYVLAMPVSRGKVIITMIAVYITGLLFIVAANFLSGAAGVLLVENSGLDVNTFFSMHILGFLLFFAMGGYSFLFSVLFTEERHVLAFAGGLTIVFYMLDITGRVNEDVEGIRSASIFSLFEPSAILSGDANVATASMILAAAGLAGYILSFYIFQKKDLPL